MTDKNATLTPTEAKAVILAAVDQGSDQSQLLAAAQVILEAYAQEVRLTVAYETVLRDHDLLYQAEDYLDLNAGG